MSRFVINNEMFGKYAKILTNYSKDEFIYKIISLFESNTYQDVPVLLEDKPTIHEKVIPVLNVVQCGIDESKVIRVALKDCLIVNDINNEKEVYIQIVHAHWIKQNGFGKLFACSNCEEFTECGEDKYCRHCGAIMDGKENKHE